MEADIGHCLVVEREMVDLQPLFSRLVPDARKQHADPAAGHQFHELGVRGAACLDRCDLVSVAQHRDAIGDLPDLPHAVRDIDDARAGGLELGDEIEQPGRLRFRQRGRRLIEDEEADFGQECLGDLHHLLVGARQVSDLGSRVEVEAEVTHYRLCPVAHRRAVEEAAPCQLATKKQVLLDREVGNEAELLEYWADPDGSRGMRRKLGYLLALIAKAARVGREGPGDDVDESGLAGAVLAEKHVDLAVAKVEIHSIERDDAGKALGDLAQFEEESAGVTDLRRSRRRVGNRRNRHIGSPQAIACPHPVRAP